jgi:hypothetical protein
MRTGTLGSIATRPYIRFCNTYVFQPAIESGCCPFISPTALPEPTALIRGLGEYCRVTKRKGFRFSVKASRQSEVVTGVGSVADYAAHANFISMVVARPPRKTLIATGAPGKISSNRTVKVSLGIFSSETAEARLPVFDLVIWRPSR